MTAKSINLAGSGFIAAINGALTTRRRVLVLTNNKHFARALYERLQYRIVGMFCPASFHENPAPFTTSNSTPSNLTAGSAMWPYRNDFQPNAGGGAQREGYAYNVTSATWDGTTGIQANFIPIGGWKECFWAQGADVAADAQIAAFTLSGSYTPAVEAAWYERALTCIAVAHVPAANTAGPPTLPIAGGPSLKVGARRGAAAYALGSASSLTTTAQYVALSTTLSAASGLPSISLNNGATATNRAARCIPVGAMFKVTDTAVAGIELVVLGWETARHASISGIDAATIGMDTAPTINGLAAAIGITQFDAVIVDLSSAIEFNFTTGDLVNHLSSLLTGDVAIPAGGSAGTWGEYVCSDFENHLRDEVTSVGHSCPIAWIDSHPTGHISDDITAPAIANGALVYGAQKVDFEYAVTHPLDTQFGVGKGAYINWNGNCGFTTQTILTSSKVTLGGTTYGGIWSAGSKVQGSVWFHSQHGNAALDPPLDNRTGGTRAFVVTAASTTKEPGIDASWDDEWDELDLSPTAAATDEKVDFIQARIDAPDHGNTYLAYGMYGMIGLEEFITTRRRR